MDFYNAFHGNEVQMKEVPLPSETKEIDIGELDKPFAAEPVSSEGDVKRELSNEQKAEIKSQTGWSDEIIDSIGSIEEYEVYSKLDLIECQIGGKPCLIRPDIDMNQTDKFGRTNAERMKQGLAPLTPEGRPYELHHIGQHQDSPLAELTFDEHRGKGNDTVLHNKTKESEIDRGQFDKERENYWKSRTGDDI